MQREHNHHDHADGQAREHGHTRRDFLCRCCLGVAGAVSASVFAPPVLAAGEVAIKATHGTGLCNLGLFLVKERDLARPDGVALQFVNTASVADISTVFGSGQVDVSMIPYTNLMTLIDKGAPVQVVAGGGVEGLMILGAAGIKSAKDAKGKSLATFQADTLEVLPYDWLKKNGMSFSDIDVRYFGSAPEMSQAFIAGNVDLLCHNEPYASQALKGRKGAVELSDGTDIYDKHYTDCVLAARVGLIKEKREALKGLIKAMLAAQHQIENDRKSAAEATVGKYYKASLDVVLDAAGKQPVIVDQRSRTQFIIDRSQSVKELGYIQKPLTQSAFDWSLLEEVIAENKPLYDSLKLKTA